MISPSSAGQYDMMQKYEKSLKAWHMGYNSSESTQREHSNEYQHDIVWVVFKTFCIFLPWMKVALALEGLNGPYVCISPFSGMVSASSVTTHGCMRSRFWGAVIAVLPVSFPRQETDCLQNLPCCSDHAEGVTDSAGVY